jgi:two-component system, LytTR family, response regulator
MLASGDKKIRVIIADDEPAARASMEILLSKEKDIELVCSCCDGKEAIEAINGLQPDLVFLDIQMPEKNGFEVLEEINIEPVPAIVFVTAFDQYAIRAFEKSAIDYLLKPYDDERFYQSLQRARKLIEAFQLQQQNSSLIHLLAFLKQSPSGTMQYSKRLTVKSNGKISFIPVDSIHFIESEGNFVKINTQSGLKAGNYTFKQLDLLLDPEKFIRIHKSFIVNVDQIEMIEPYFHGDYQVLLKDGSKLKLSRNYKHSLDRIAN